MSKYYKAEDVIRAIAEQLCWIARTEYGDKFTTEDWLEEAEDYVSDLPTIEVSEGVIGQDSGDFDLQAVVSTGQEIYAKGYEDGRKSIEISEDCISRKWLEEHKDVISYTNEWEETEIDECVFWKNIENAPSVMPKTQTETQNSNENSNVISVYDEVSEAVRCAMCSNPNKSDRGCDGACSYDEKLYKRIMDAINASRFEVSEDCISREWVLEKFQKGKEKIGKSEFFDELMWLVKHAPSVVPKEKIGTRTEEEVQTVYGKIIRLTCCECGDVVNVSESAYPYEKYCRYCGAKMRLE